MGVTFSYQKLNLEIDEKYPIIGGKEIHGKVETLANAAITQAALKIEVCGDLCLTLTHKKSKKLIVEKKKILRETQILVSKSDQLKRGKQEHRFCIKLPQDLPPSINYQGENGESLKIRYFVKAKLEMQNWFVKTVKDIQVVAPPPQLSQQQLEQQRENYQVSLPPPSQQIHKFPVDAQLCSERVQYGQDVKIFVSIHNYPKLYKIYPNGILNLLERVTLNLPSGNKCLQHRYCYHKLPELLNNNQTIQLNYKIQGEENKQDQSYNSELIKIEHFVELQFLKNRGDITADVTGHKLQLPIVILPKILQA